MSTYPPPINDDAGQFDQYYKMRPLFAEYCLQPLYCHDAEALFTLTDNNRVYLARYLLWLDSVVTQQDTANFIDTVHQGVSKATSLIFAIHNNEGIIGTAGFIVIDLILKQGIIGYWIAEQFQGHGIVTSACKNLIDIGFGEIGLDKIIIICHADNIKSQSIAARIGFKKSVSVSGAKDIDESYKANMIFHLDKS